MNASHVPSIVFACGDCAGEIIRAGGKWAPVDEIPFGKVCQVHPPGRSDMVATNAMVTPEGWARPEVVKSDPCADTSSSPLPTTMGPLTEIATRLIVAWSAADRTATDKGTVNAAVLVAERILKSTNGA
jgi:hypothetical protein